MIADENKTRISPRRRGDAEKSNVTKFLPLTNTDDTDWGKDRVIGKSGHREIGKAKAEKFLPRMNTDNTDWGKDRVIGKSGHREIGKAKAEKFLPRMNTDNTDWDRDICAPLRCAQALRRKAVSDPNHWWVKIKW
jgi:hypothetical protein